MSQRREKLYRNSVDYGLYLTHYTRHSVTKDDNCTTDEHTVDIADIYSPNSLLKDTSDGSLDEGEVLLFLYMTLRQLGIASKMIILWN